MKPSSAFSPLLFGLIATVFVLPAADAFKKPPEPEPVREISLTPVSMADAIAFCDYDFGAIFVPDRDLCLELVVYDLKGEVCLRNEDVGETDPPFAAYLIDRDGLTCLKPSLKKV